jgi:two-component system response regulator MprA
MSVRRRREPEERRQPEQHRPILVVDDDLHVRKMLRHLFELDGLEVIEAEDGRAALNDVLARQPAVLVTDLQMPGLDGLSLCRVLRGAGFRTLARSGCTGAARQSVGLSRAVVTYLLPSFSEDSLSLDQNRRTPVIHR